MSFEKLSQMGFIHEFKDVSDGPHSSKFCFVLGAGASKASGIKMGQELVDIWEKELKERNAEDYENWKHELNITEENKYSFYSQFYEKRFEKRPVDGLNFLEKMMENVSPSVGYVVLSYILTHKQHNVVITTNFDHLTEDAVNYYEKTLPLIIGHESLSNYISKQITRPTIIKIHRDLLFDPKNTSKDVGTLHDAWKTSLGLIFSEYHPVFIGYAGNDNSLMDYLIENSEKFINGEWKFPYWTLYKSEKPKGKVEEFLNGSGGYCINCNGFDELLCLLGAELGYKKPNKKAFLDDAKKRFYALTEAFEKIMFDETVSRKKESIVAKSIEDTEVQALASAVQKIVGNTDFDKKYIDSIELHNQKEYEEALKLKQELVADNPKSSRYHHSLGLTLLELERYSEAENETRKAIEIDSKNASYYDTLSLILLEMGRFEEAEKEASKAIEIEPDNTWYNYGYLAALNGIGKYKEAAIVARKIIELEPNNPVFHDSLSLILTEMDQYEEAEQETRKAIELDPDEAEFYDTLSMILSETNRLKEAEKAIRKAIELEPDDDDYRERLDEILKLINEE